MTECEVKFGRDFSGMKRAKNNGRNQKLFRARKPNKSLFSQDWTTETAWKQWGTISKKNSSLIQKYRWRPKIAVASPGNRRAINTKYQAPWNTSNLHLHATKLHNKSARLAKSLNDVTETEEHKAAISLSGSNHSQKNSETVNHDENWKEIRSHLHLE